MPLMDLAFMESWLSQKWSKKKGKNNSWWTVLLTLLCFHHKVHQRLRENGRYSSNLNAARFPANETVSFLWKYNLDISTLLVYVCLTALFWLLNVVVFFSCFPTQEEYQWSTGNLIWTQTLFFLTTLTCCLNYTYTDIPIRGASFISSVQACWCSRLLYTVLVELFNIHMFTEPNTYVRWSFYCDAPWGC